MSGSGQVTEHARLPSCERRHPRASASSWNVPRACYPAAYPAAKPPRHKSVQSPSTKLTLPCCIRRQSATALALPCCDPSLVKQTPPSLTPSAPSRPCSPDPPLSPPLPGPPHPQPPAPSPSPILSACTHTRACAHAHTYLPTHHIGPVHLHPHLPSTPSTSRFRLWCLHVQTSSHVLRPVLPRPTVCK